MELIFRWVAGALSLILAKYANPQLQANLDAYNAKIVEFRATVSAAAEEQAKAEAATAASKAAFEESERERAQLDVKIAESKRLRALDQQKLKEIEEGRVQDAKDHEQRLQDIANRPPVDRIEMDLPGTGRKGGGS